MTSDILTVNFNLKLRIRFFLTYPNNKRISFDRPKYTEEEYINLYFYFLLKKLLKNFGRMQKNSKQ